MALPQLNPLAILAAAVVGMAIGALWFSPMLFGKIWMRLNKIKPSAIKKAKKKGMGKTFFLQFLALLVMSFVISVALKSSGYNTLSQGFALGFWSWAGFVMPITIGTVLWGKKPLKLWALEDAHNLLVILTMALILSVWN